MAATAQQRAESFNLAAWLLRRVRERSARAEPRLRLVESLSLGGRRYVSLVECDGRAFLLGGQMGSVQCIAPVAQPAPRAADPTAAAARQASEHEAEHEAEPVAPEHKPPGTHATKTKLGRWLAGTVVLRIRHAGQPRAQRDAMREAGESFAAAMTKHRDGAEDVAAVPESAAARGQRVSVTVSEHDDLSAVLPETEEHGGESVEQQLVAWAIAQARGMDPQIEPAQERGA